MNIHLEVRIWSSFCHFLVDRCVNPLGRGPGSEGSCWKSLVEVESRLVRNDPLSPIWRGEVQAGAVGDTDPNIRKTCKCLRCSTKLGCMRYYIGG